MKLSLSQRIYRYLKNRPGVKVNGGEIERLALSIGYKASNASRRCREMREKGLIRDAEIKGTVSYWYEPEDSLESKLDQMDKYFASI